MFPNRSLMKAVPLRPRPSVMARRAALALASTIGAVTLCALAALPVAAAQAATTTACPSATLVQPFLSYGDQNYYRLVPGGSFEGSTTGWSFSGGAKVASKGEPSTVGGSLGADSLELPAGASAQSPFTCVEPNERKFRFFAHSEGSTATILVSVVYESSLGNITLPIRQLALKSAWEPSPILQTGAPVATAISGGVAHLALRFTSVSGTARIDDVYLDPRMR